ncbi:MAG: hypothetical protein UMR38_02630, partial [Candidatus Izemoplasma sp.]|nr:hypothetical protein [Candidatus Izemoplasma sp.]
MRKIFIIIGMFVLSLGLYGCQEDGETVTPPSFVSFTVDNQVPVEDGELVTFFKEKQAETLIKVELTNPDNVLIKSIVINGYNYHSTRFTDASTSTLKVFPMSAGTTLGASEYTIDEITYMDGETVKSVRGFDNNAFKLYVYKDEPTITRENYSVSQNSISIDFDITDIDDVILEDSLKAKLFSGDTLIEEKTLTKGLVTVLFEDLKANSQYELKVQSSYNLDNNQGTQSNVVMYTGTFETVATGLPSASIANLDVEDTTITFDVAIQDDDNVIVDGGLVVAVYDDEDTLFDTVGLTGSTTGVTIDGLLNDTDYEVRIMADYDLRDGQGVLTNKVLAKTSFVTAPQAVPQPNLSNLIVAENTIDFDIVLDDPNNLVFEESLTANLYFGETPAGTVDVIDYRVGFDVVNVFANTEFTIEIVGNYDLNDGNGIQTNEIIYTETFSTLEKSAPTITVNNTLVTQGYVTLNFEVDDPNDTITNNAMVANLYEDDTLVKTIQFNPNATQIIFDYATVYTEQYYVEILADYNLSDNTGLKTNQKLYRGIIVTGEKKAPVAEFSNISSDTSSIDMTVTVIDADSTIEANTLFLDIYVDGSLQSSEPLVVGENTLSIGSLLSNNQYEFNVRTNYDLADSSGVMVDQILNTTTFNTKAKTLPTGAISETIDRDTTSFTFDYLIDDPNNVIVTDSILVELILDGEVKQTLTPSTLEEYDLTFTGLLSNTQYTIKLYVDYDLNDGNGVISKVLIAEVSPKTNAKSAPTATIEYLDVTFDETNNVFNVELGTKVSDPDNVITGGLEAQLILNDVVQATEPLSIGNNSNLTFGDINLLTNQRYFIQIVSNYDLNDEATIKTADVITRDTFITSALDAPDAVIDNIVVSNNSVTFDVTITDSEEVITSNLEAMIYQDNTLVDSKTITVGLNEDVTFTGLTSSSDYVIMVETDYNLNDDDGEQTDQLLEAIDITTETNALPIASLSNIETSHDTLDVTVTYTDIDGVITGNRSVSIYDEANTLIDTKALSTNTETVQFTGLLSDQTYT